jgi:hypothetical protein
MHFHEIMVQGNNETWREYWHYMYTLITLDRTIHSQLRSQSSIVPTFRIVRQLSIPLRSLLPQLVSTYPETYLGQKRSRSLHNMYHRL